MKAVPALGESFSLFLEVSLWIFMIKLKNGG